MMCMAKRGEKRPWKVRFEWSNGVKGVITCATEEEADRRASEIRSASEWQPDADVTVTVEKVG